MNRISGRPALKAVVYRHKDLSLFNPLTEHSSIVGSYRTRYSIKYQTGVDRENNYPSSPVPADSVDCKTSIYKGRRPLLVT